MTIALVTREQPAKVSKAGSGQYTLVEGERVRVQTREDGQLLTHLNEVVPAGEEWHVRIEINVIVNQV